nr:MAG TPA: hypothetical protein [Bacteriophage sp.]
MLAVTMSFVVLNSIFIPSALSCKSSPRPLGACSFIDITGVCSFVYISAFILLSLS